MVRAVNWEFNAWGGEVDGLYASWKLDNAFAKAFSAWQGYECYEAAPFVLEGGSIHSDGEGTVLVTASCLLSKGRNPELSKKQIEEKLKSYLGAEKILWLPRGIYLDETNEHVDNVCAFLKPGEVVLAWTDNEDDPQYVLSKACLDYLESECRIPTFSKSFAVFSPIPFKVSMDWSFAIVFTLLLSYPTAQSAAH